MHTIECATWIGIFIGFTASRESTVCYVNGNPVNEHYLNCSDSMIVSVSNAAYGYRRKIDDKSSSCQLKDSDRFVSFPLNLLHSIKEQCLNQASCSRFKIPFSENQTESLVRSTIEYSCEWPTGNQIARIVLLLIYILIAIVLIVVQIPFIKRSQGTRKGRSTILIV